MKAMKMKNGGTALVLRSCVAAVCMLAAGTTMWLPRAATAQGTGGGAVVKSAEDVKGMLTPALPANAKEIAAVMTTAKVGEVITIRGNIVMATDAFGEKVATFTLGDESARTGERPALDKLPASDAGIAAAARATVQIADASGVAMGFGLSGQQGLKAGAEVFVTGKVVAANGASALVVNATSLHVARSAMPMGFFTEKPAASARDVSEARASGGLKAGDEVVLRGRIGGSKEPFVAGRAVFTLMGRGLKACNEISGDKCLKPWDYCCDTKEEILANSVTVQVVDEKGQPLRTDTKGRRGLKELSEVVVVGKVLVADGKAVVINAKSMHVAQ